jgi:class 3 adenylate cyclase
VPEERRVVTVLFADVTGSTALGESSDPEDVRAVLGRYYAIARETIASHGGTLEKFIGDAVMAIFGLPQAHGDDADRALAAALVLRDAVARDAITAKLRLRIGVNTGEVVASRESTAGDFLVTGDAVNIAARLQQHADPGAILVGARTRTAVAGAFRFGEELRIDVKGKSEPLRATVLEERLGERVAARAPLVGREPDLAQLALIAARAFSERRPQLVTVTAPAGTGKSRLVEEFIARLESERPVTVATAQCLPYGAAVTYLPLRGLVRGLLGIPGDGDAVARVREAFAAAGHSAADAERLSQLVGLTLGTTSEPEERDRDQLFAAWRLLIEALSQRGPVVVVFEDLHWASDSLLDLVDHVTLPRTAAPLVMVALARPELLDRRPGWGGGRRNFSSLGLEPLTPDETRRLVALMTETVPGTMADRIVERAGGNPFFAGELVRAYEERRRAGIEDEEIVLPDTVHATVLARLDGLPADERAVLEYAAVVGRSARATAVAALLPDRTQDAIDSALESLAERDLVVRHAPGAYTFRHIVIREVAYATLPRAERVRAHVRMADFLDRHGASQGEEMAELVAYHYRQAIALSPGGRTSEDLPIGKVVPALERAARVAWAGGAFGESAELIREAIRLSPPEEHQRLYELLGDVMRFSDAAVEGFREAYERWRASVDPDPRAGARLLVKRIAVISRWSGSLSRPPNEEEFAALDAEAQRLLAAAPDHELRARLDCARAFANMRFPRDRETTLGLLRGAKAARAFFAERGDRNAESEALDAVASVNRSGLGDWEAALAAGRERLAHADRLDLLERIDAWSVLLWDLTCAGRYAEAIRRYDDGALPSLRPGEAESALAHATAWAAYAAAVSGAWDDALRFGDALVVAREDSRDAVGRFTTHGWIAVTRVAAARLDETRVARYRSALQAVAQMHALDPTSEVLLSYRALLDGDAESARKALARPIVRPERTAEVIYTMIFDLGAPPDETALRRIESDPKAAPPLLTLRVQLARAVNGDDAALRKAIAALDTGGLVGDAARAAALLAMRTRDDRDRTEAERRLNALGDRLYLQRLAETT